MTLGASSCSDMLDVESSGQLSDQDITSKTDSVFYTFGVMNAMQQLADAYVLQNEMRGDMVTTTMASDKNLRELADFSAASTNKYDSAYLYYKVINNVNYYAAHRDTTLKDGATNVVTGEYAAMLTFRAWAYLQAVRTFGAVKYFTHPLTKISDIENDASPVLQHDDVVRNLIADLEPYTGTPVPNYGTINCGRTNKGATKNAVSTKCFIPVDVMLGELYLELGDKASCLKAVEHYYKYIVSNGIEVDSYFAGMVKDPNSNKEVYSFSFWNDDITLPQDFSLVASGSVWGLYDNNAIVSYIPMAANRLTGTTSELPKIFGYDYYSTDSTYVSDIQIVASDSYHSLADNCAYYYKSSDDNLGRTFKSFAGGDTRRPSTLTRGVRNKLDKVYINGYKEANVVLFRVSTIWLHLAEALNRAGYPDAAFAVLKDGLKSTTPANSYISEATADLLSGSFFSSDNEELFKDNMGIHGYGCGQAGVGGEFSPYQMAAYEISTGNTESVIMAKIEELNEKMNINVVPTTMTTTVRVSPDITDFTSSSVTSAVYKAVPEDKSLVAFSIDKENVTEIKDIVDEEEVVVAKELSVELTLVSKDDAINAIEDLLCDEYAMELPFMGCRFADLMRLARHKNDAGVYGANFGGLWLDKKIRDNNPNVSKSLVDSSSWYLPFN